MLSSLFDRCARRDQNRFGAQRPQTGDIEAPFSPSSLPVETERWRHSDLPARGGGSMSFVNCKDLRILWGPSHVERLGLKVRDRIAPPTAVDDELS
jgi:hypothetical protein